MKPGTRWTSGTKRFLTFLLRLALGSVLVYAGFSKYSHPYQFAEIIIAYQLLPHPLVGLTAAIVPWVEMVSGALLILGIKPRSCLLLIQIVLLIFMMVLAVTMLRGLNIDCGCGLFSERQVGFLALLEDGLLLALAGWLYRVEIKRVLPAPYL
ncbi:MAG: MauE/DoxX family redox-associated membrane protein [Desulfobacteraceae bacterium]